MSDRGIIITRIPRQEPPCEIFYDAATGMYLLKMAYTAEFLEPLLHPDHVPSQAPVTHHVTVHVPAKEFINAKDNFVLRLLESEA